MKVSPQPSDMFSATNENVVIFRPSGIKRVLIRIGLPLFLFASCGMFVFHAYIAWTLGRPQIEPLQSNPFLAFGVPYMEVQFPSRDGKTTMDAWYIPGNSDSTVVFSHGYGGNREEIWVPIYDLAEVLNKNDYNVLMFDYYYVRPEGVITGGVRESQELLGAVDYAKQSGAEQVFIWGFSMGAGTALQAALDEPGIDGMILDSTFLLDPDTLYHNVKQYVDIPKYPSLPLIRLFFPIFNGAGLHEIPYERIKSARYPMPIFFIHGEKDRKAPYEIAERLYLAQKEHPHSQLWLLKHGAHELIYKAQPEQYIEKTLRFLREIRELRAL